MIRTIKKLFGIGAAVCMFFACSTPSFIITEGDTGKKMDVYKDSVFAVKLEAQLGTGYSWKVESGGADFEQIGKPDVITSGQKKTGGIDIQVFTFKAIKAGQCELKFVYVEPWKKDSKPKKSFNILINVKIPEADKKDKK